jgi:large-conductance mechanosensitive channel
MSGDSTIMTFAVALYIGMALAQFFGSITHEFVLPILAGLFPGAEGAGEKIYISVGSVRINIGAVLEASFNLMIAYLVVSFTLPYVRMYAPVGGRK